jgi:cysteine desulfurase
MKQIYLDYQATTPIDPRVLKAMLPFLKNEYGNAASNTHSFGWKAHEAVELARRQIADLIGANPKEIVFTSGATESDNLALIGVAKMHPRRSHIITTVIEHKAILDTCKYLEKEGYDVSYIPVDNEGLVDVSDIEKAITPKTILISVMHVNNEIGTIQPIKEIGKIAKKHNILFHTDAAQSIGKIGFKVDDYSIDLMSMSAHKIYGPKGIGALYVRKGTKISPIIHGGGHEGGLRSGTLNVPSIVGFGKTCELAQKELPLEVERITRLRDKLYTGLKSVIKDIRLNGHSVKRIPGNLNINFLSLDGSSLLAGLKRIAVSAGSACTSASLEPSFVLKAIGLDDNLANSPIRIGIGRFTTEKDIDIALKEIIQVAKGQKFNS